jgi:hypothetical protein
MLEHTIRATTIMLDGRCTSRMMRAQRATIKHVLSPRMLFISPEVFLHLHFPVRATSLPWPTHPIMTLPCLVLVIIIVAICGLALPLRMLNAALDRKIGVCQTLHVETSMLCVCFGRLVINILLLVCTLLVLKGVVAFPEGVYLRALKLVAC